jgi:PII-like signaling protein
MPRCSVVLEDATLLRGVEGCYAAPWASFNTIQQRGIQQYGAAWHPPTQWGSVASINNMEQREATLLRGVEGCHDVRGVEGCHAAPWC